MIAKTKLVHNAWIYSIGGFFPKVLSYLLLPLYTAHLSTANYGNFDILMVTIGLLIPILTISLPDAVYRFSITEDERGRSKAFSTAVSIILRNLFYFDCLAVLVILIFRFQYSWLFFALANISIFSGVLTQALRATGKIVVFSMLQILSSMVMIVLNIFLIVFVGMKVEALLLSNIFAEGMLILCVAYYLKIWSFFDITAISEDFKKVMVDYSWPLVLSTASWWVMLSSDRYVISFFCGLGATGIYSIANKLPSLFMMLYLNFGSSWQDAAISVYGKKESGGFYTKTFDGVSTFMLSAGLVCIASSRYILKIMVSSSFYESWRYTPFLFLGVIFYVFSSFFAVGFHCAKKTKSSFYTSAIGAAVNIIGNLIFVPLWGLQGAAIVTCLSFFVMWIARACVLKDLFKIEIKWQKILSLFVLLGMVIVFYYHLKNDYQQLALFLATIMIFIAYNRSLIVSVSRKFQKHLILLIKRKLNWR